MTQRPHLGDLIMFIRKLLQRCATFDKVVKTAEALIIFRDQAIHLRQW